MGVFPLYLHIGFYCPLVLCTSKSPLFVRTRRGKRREDSAINTKLYRQLHYVLLIEVTNMTQLLKVEGFGHH